MDLECLCIRFNLHSKFSNTFLQNNLYTHILIERWILYSEKLAKIQRKWGKFILREFSLIDWNEKFTTNDIIRFYDEILNEFQIIYYWWIKSSFPEVYIRADRRRRVFWCNYANYFMWFILMGRLFDLLLL